MELKDTWNILPLLLIVIGWFVNNFYARRHEISKKKT